MSMTCPSSSKPLSLFDQSRLVITRPCPFSCVKACACAVLAARLDSSAAMIILCMSSVPCVATISCPACDGWRRACGRTCCGMQMERPQPGSAMIAKPDRRQILAGIGSTVLFAGGSHAQPSGTLADAAARGGLSFGAAVRARTLEDPAARDMLARETATLTPELELKWGALAPSADRRDTVGADLIAAFARKSGKDRSQRDSDPHQCHEGCLGIGHPTSISPE
ncbi:MAG: hypothetical protein EOP89_10560 [Lysobacteraceae bacterium]|nr:MAG: hypothetical protein EOP89_10560 [Xanthomonadaceae bacterium]